MVKEGKTFGKRFEKKYVVQTNKLTEYIEKNSEDLNKKFASDHLVDDAGYTLIENTYFDNINLDSYHQSLEKSPVRKKLRLRTYAIDGKKNDMAYFEIKGKEFQQTIKERVALKAEWLDSFIGYGYYHLNDVCSVNPMKTRGEVKDVLEKINFMIHHQGYNPILKSSYKRLAFKLKHKKSALRITIDKDLHFERLRNTNSVKIDYQKTIADNQSVIEVKYKGKEDLAEICEIKEDLGSSTGFSKYCYGVFSTQVAMPQKMFGPVISSIKPAVSTRVARSI